MLVDIGIWFVGRRCRMKGQQPTPIKSFTIPKEQRLDTAIATIELTLEETDNETIRRALQARLEQLKDEREQRRKRKGA